MTLPDTVSYRQDRNIPQEAGGCTPELRLNHTNVGNAADTSIMGGGQHCIRECGRW